MCRIEAQAIDITNFGDAEERSDWTAVSCFTFEHEGTSRLDASETLTAAKTHDVNK
jgi:hypothetical protein